MTSIKEIFGSIRGKGVEIASLATSRFSEKKCLVILGVIVGLLAGIGAALLKTLIGDITHLVTHNFIVSSFQPLLLILPLLGILVTGLFTRYVLHEDLEFGTEKIIANLKGGNYRLPRNLTWSPIAACSLTLGMGASAGSEGPIAYAGAAMGSNLGKYFRLSDETLRLLVIIGAAAGIAGIFKAPIGGMAFALEVLAMPLSTAAVVALIGGCITASTAAYVLSGFTLDIAFRQTVAFDPSMIPAVLLLGVFCGIYSLYYNYTGRKTEHALRRISSPWVKYLATGIGVAALVFVFPSLYGEGFGAVDQIINGYDVKLLDNSLFFGISGQWIIIIVLASLIAVKAIVTYATNSGGGVGGDFAPTLYAGCMAGLLFAKFSNTALGTALPEADFALFGMAGVMAGTVQAPIMAIFITVEMCGDFSMFFPFILVSTVSFTMMRILRVHYHFNLRPSWMHTTKNYSR